MNRVSTWIIGPLLAVLALGIALLLLATPRATQELSSRFTLAQEAGLTTQQALEIAEQVRAFVIDGTGELPATVQGREGFDEAAVSHLEDVRRVIAGAKLATGICAAIVMLWMGWLVVKRRVADAAPAFKVGAVFSAVFVVLVGLVGLVDFDAFFSAFHGVFFAQGTWTFPYDSLLIQLFPEPFWASAGALWAGLTVLIGVAWWGVGVWLARPSTKPDA